MKPSDFFIKSFRDGEPIDYDYYTKKYGEIIEIHEDTTTRLYIDDKDIDVAALYAESIEVPYVIKEVGSINDNVHSFECVTSCDGEFEHSKTLCAYDKEGDCIYAASYLDVDENEIYRTSETIGRAAALQILEEEIDGDSDVVEIR